MMQKVTFRIKISLASRKLNWRKLATLKTPSVGRPTAQPDYEVKFNQKVN